jgi:hypothetical protein
MALGCFRRASKNFSGKTLFFSRAQAASGVSHDCPPNALFDAFLTAIEIDRRFIKGIESEEINSIRTGC